MSVCLKLKISVSTKPIGLYSSGKIPTGPVTVLSYFLVGWDTPNPPKNKKMGFNKKNIFLKISIMQSRMMSVRMSVHLSVRPLSSWLPLNRLDFTLQEILLYLLVLSWFKAIFVGGRTPTTPPNPHKNK